MKIQNNVVLELPQIRFGENRAILIPFKIALEVYDEAVSIANYNERTAEEYQQFKPSDYFFYALNNIFPIQNAIEHTSSERDNKSLWDDFEDPNNLNLNKWDDLGKIIPQENLWQQFQKQISQLKEQKTTINKKILKEIIKQELRKINLI